MATLNSTGFTKTASGVTTVRYWSNVSSYAYDSMNRVTFYMKDGNEIVVALSETSYESMATFLSAIDQYIGGSPEKMVYSASLVIDVLNEGELNEQTIVVATEHENTFGDVVWEYVDNGKYTATLANDSDLILKTIGYVKTDVVPITLTYDSETQVTVTLTDGDSDSPVYFEVVRYIV